MTAPLSTYTRIAKEYAKRYGFPEPNSAEEVANFFEVGLASLSDDVKLQVRRELQSAADDPDQLPFERIYPSNPPFPKAVPGAIRRVDNIWWWVDVLGKILRPLAPEDRMACSPIGDWHLTNATSQMAFGSKQPPDPTGALSATALDIESAIAEIDARIDLRILVEQDAELGEQQWQFIVKLVTSGTTHPPSVGVSLARVEQGRLSRITGTRTIRPDRTASFTRAPPISDPFWLLLEWHNTSRRIAKIEVPITG